MHGIIDFILHMDKHLASWIASYQAWTYLILFTIIFCETGFVVTPFLPGDSILFMAGFFASTTGARLNNVAALNLGILIMVMSAAAILGDTVNYWIGAKIGPKAFRRDDARFLKKKYLDETHNFYEKYGAATIILARFVPIVRTFAPFVAGIGEMTYMHFLAYNIIGGIAWVTIFLLAGFFFGNVKFVHNNFLIVIIVIVLISVLPMVIKALSERRKRRAAVLVAAGEVPEE